MNKYEFLDKICDGCDQIKKTRQVEGLDPLRKDIKNFLCRKCDHSCATIPKILKFNKKEYKETHSIFGFPLSEKDKIKSIEISII